MLWHFHRSRTLFRFSSEKQAFFYSFQFHSFYIQELHLYVLLLPAYVVRREGNSFTLFVSPHLGGGGYPYPIMLCNISQNAMGQTRGGVPCQVQPGGIPCRGGGYPVGGTKVGYPPQQGTPQPGRGDYQGRVPPQPGQDGGGGTQLGQQKEHSLHGGRYASCVHAGGLSCY